MPEKKNGGFKKIFEDYVKDYVIDAVHFFFSMLERRMKRYAVSCMLSVASIVVILYGIGTLLGYLIPALVPGTSHIIVGVLFLLAARMYSKQ